MAGFCGQFSNENNNAVHKSFQRRDDTYLSLYRDSEDDFASFFVISNLCLLSLLMHCTSLS